MKKPFECQFPQLAIGHGSQLTMVNAGTVRAVKNLICILASIWLTFMSAGAYAHAANDAERKAEYTNVHAAQKNQKDAAAFDAPASAGVSHFESCNHSHCGHGHLAGPLAQDRSCGNTDTAISAPSACTNWATSHIVNNIERPKWPFTTPVVVNLLS